MKLKNKKTGEIVDASEVLDMKQDDGVLYKYYSLAELNEEWEDAPEEPKVFWYIEGDGDIHSIRAELCDELEIHTMKQIGNYFLSREEAEKAVEKLKAWKRLKDKGFRFRGWIREHKKGSADITIASFIDYDFDITDDIDLLFGGEE